MQSENLGYEMVRGINSIIGRVDGWEIDWQEQWHNIAYDFSKKRAEGIDINDQEVQETPLLKMMDAIAYDRLQIEVAQGSALLDSGSVQSTIEQFEAALNDHFGQSTGAIGVYQQGDQAYFTLLRAMPIKIKVDALNAKSYAFGKKGIELINSHRSSEMNLPPLTWDEKLYEFAFNRSKDILEGNKV